MTDPFLFQLLMVLLRCNNKRVLILISNNITKKIKIINFLIKKIYFIFIIFNLISYNHLKKKITKPYRYYYLYLYLFKLSKLLLI